MKWKEEAIVCKLCPLVENDHAVAGGIDLECFLNTVA